MHGWTMCHHCLPLNSCYFIRVKYICFWITPCTFILLYITTITFPPDRFSPAGSQGYEKSNIVCWCGASPPFSLVKRAQSCVSFNQLYEMYCSYYKHNLCFTDESPLCRMCQLPSCTSQAFGGECVCCVLSAPHIGSSMFVPRSVCPPPPPLLLPPVGDTYYTSPWGCTRPKTPTPPLPHSSHHISIIHQ